MLTVNILYFQKFWGCSGQKATNTSNNEAKDQFMRVPDDRATRIGRQLRPTGPEERPQGHENDTVSRGEQKEGAKAAA